MWVESTKSNKVAAQEAYDLIQKRRLNPTHRWGYTWGFKDIDDKTGGIQWEGGNEMSVVAARSGVGKSAFAITVALAVAHQFQAEYPDLEVRICLLEMTATACYSRLYSQIAGVDLTSMQRGYVTQEENRRLEQAKLLLQGLPINWMEGMHGTTNIEQFVRATSKAGKRCGLWIVDHIGIIPNDAAKTGNSAMSLGSVAEELHRITRQTAPSLVLAQLNRTSLLRKDPTPNATDLYGADRIYHITDNVYFLYRPESTEEASEHELAYFILEKQRSGEANGRKLPMLFTPKRVAWADLPDELREELQLP